MNIKKEDCYPVFEEGVYLKILEEPCVYNTENDELYEINDEAVEFLEKCNGLNPLSALSYDEEFLAYCIDEKLLCLKQEKKKFFQPQPLKKPPFPSLRYLELQVTDRCNLACRHCYLGKSKKRDLDAGTMESVFKQFEVMQGLRMIISGGEPLMHPEFWKINEMLKGRSFRSILLTNGTLLTKDNIGTINVGEYQISVDGLQESHDAFRGKGTFKKAMDAVEMLIKNGKDVSVGTMVNRYNRNDFPEMEELFTTLGVREWSVDIPVEMGYARGQSASIFLPANEASAYLRFGFGGGLYKSSGDYVCGAHLCAVTPSGDVCKCGFYADSPSGNIKDKTLKTCWEKIEKGKLGDLECGRCEYLSECRGGCRYRAFMEGTEKGVDSVKCFFFGVKKSL